MRIPRIALIGFVLAWLGSSGAVDADHPQAHAGSEVCMACHEDQAKTLIHPGAGKDANCEGCHGPGQAHVDAAGAPGTIRSFGTMPAAEVALACRTCHTQSSLKLWEGSQHASADVSCISCHAAHRAEGPSEHLLARGPLETCFQCHQIQRTQILKSSHMPLRENKMDCADCHNPHGSPTPALIRDQSVQENCYRCHADKRGPLLFEHPPVRENCLNCHVPHGSMHESLLVTKRPRLCQTCHVASRHPSDPRTNRDRFVFNSSCQNCHIAVHGSNHPAGIRQMR